MYRSVTHGVQVTVEPRFLPEHSAPDNGRFVWAYTVEIVNLSSDVVQLRSRYWRITDGKGIVHEVRGEGVVGEQPVIAPGASYQYTSGCPLETPSGIMSGHYVMTTLDGRAIDVEIPAFSLDSPFDRHVLN